MDTGNTDVKRRNTLKFLAAGAAQTGVIALGGASQTALAATPSIDLTSDSARLRAFIMMRGALDDRLVIGYISGRYYGVVDDEITPLYGVSAATFARYRQMANGSYEKVTFEQAYFTDLTTGAMLKKWRNPYTDKIVDVPVTNMPPTKVTIAPNLHFSLAKPLPGAQFEHAVLPVEVIADDVMFVEQIRVVFPGKPGSKPFRYNEITTLRASAKDLGSSDAKRVPCQTTFNGVVGWRPWLEMGDRPGHLLAQGSGRYGASIDALPKAWLEATKIERPELLIDPAKIMDAVWKS